MEVIEYLIIVKIFVVLFALLAMYFDLKTYKIPNYLNVCGLIIGVISSAFIGGLNGVLVSGLSILGVFALLFPLFAMRVMGAGDIKLFCAIAACVHKDVIFMIIVCGIITVVWGILCIAVRYIAKTGQGFTRMHLAVPIAMSSLVYMLSGI